MVATGSGLLRSKMEGHGIDQSMHSGGAAFYRALTCAGRSPARCPSFRCRGMLGFFTPSLPGQSLAFVRMPSAGSK